MALSFYPVSGGRELPERLSLLAGRAVLHGGGLLVIERWPSPGEASTLVREARSAGAADIGTLLVLNPGGFDSEGFSILERDLSPEAILHSPWEEGWIAVTGDTLLSSGEVTIMASGPAIYPSRGSSAGVDEAALSISSLD
jgi:hypothetical protein